MLHRIVEFEGADSHNQESGNMFLVEKSSRSSLPAAPGDSEQEVMLKTKTAKATVGGLSPTKEYTLQIYILNGSQEALFVKRKFVSKCGFRSLDLSVLRTVMLKSWLGGSFRSRAEARLT